MASFNGIHPLALVTHDMDMTIRYWRDLLGLPLVAGLGDKRFRHYFFALSETDMVAFVEWPSVTRNPPPEERDVFSGEGVVLREEEGLLSMKNNA